LTAGTPRMGGDVWLWLISLSLLWGGSFLFVEIALRDFEPLTIVMFRVLIGAVVLHMVLRFRNLKFPFDLKSLAQFALMGVLNNAIPFSLIVWGQQSIDAGRASVLNATVPLFTVLLAHFLLADEKLNTSKVVGVVIGFVGVFVLTKNSVGNSESANSVVGQIAILGAALSYAFASVFGRQLNRFDPQVSATGMLTASAVMMIPLAVMLESPGAVRPGFMPVIAVVLLGVACTSIAYLLYFKILLKAGSSNLSLVTFLIPPSAILMGIFFLAEAFTLNDLIGVALILTGMAIATGLLKRYVAK